ncbi:MAG: cell division protein FtsZ [Solirubrobacteraceae bacterium]|nr:cell division protein FtsZ [Solirubrobacteraceae bacterium]
MANKRERASMREGPLADLFRRTDEDSEEPRERRPEEGAEPTSEPEAQSPEAEQHPPPAHEHRPAAEPARPTGPPPTDEAPSVPTPRERLRHAFSSDIPENILEHPESPEPYPKERGDLYGAPTPAGAPVLRVVGVGGAGVNAINRMVEAEVEGVEFIAINTDLQSLQQCAAHVTLHIGADVTRGLGSGSNPDLGRQSAMEEYDKIKALLKGSDMVFVTAGSGGGTGTGAAPIVARIARELGSLAVGIVTKPFNFEGSRRREQAEDGVSALAEEVDTLIVVPNNRLLSVLDKNTSMVDAVRVADDVLRQGVQGISDLVTLPGLINLDFADVRTIMADAGNALLGIGMATGERRAIEAAEQAVASPLLETSMDGARSILLSITGGSDLSLWEVNEAAKAVAEAAHPDANIIFGAMVDEKLDDPVWVTVVATRYGEARPARKLEEPRGEPRVARGRSQERRPAAADAADSRRGGREEAPRRKSLDVAELEVPEFIPRG